MSDPIVPDDELMRVARAYMARVADQPPPQHLADDAITAALSRRRRFSLAALLGGSAVIIVGAAAAVVALAFHTAPVAGVPAGRIPAVSTVSPTTTPAITATPAPTPTPTAIANVCQVNPHPATAAQVVVNQPAPYGQFASPLTVRGEINAFEATFLIAVKDASGTNLASATGHSQQGQTLSPFSQAVSFSVRTQTPACLWVYQLSAKDGSAQTIAQVPITLMP
jgi:hypothetical protein